MPRTHNTAAASTRQMATDRRKQAIIWGIIAVVALVGVYILLTNHQLFGIGGGGLLILLIALRIIPDLFDTYSRKQEKKIRRADRGADAEEEIGSLLEQLGDDFEVLHDIESPYGNIDHVVISRQGGIYLLETKSHGGKVATTESEILVNGHTPEKDFVAQALKNSYWLREQAESLLQVKPWITPVVVFTNAFVQAGRPVKGVRVTNRKYLLNMLQKPGKGSEVNNTVWEQREKLIAKLLGRSPESEVVDGEPAKYCPKCGAELVKRTAKGGAMMGKELMVCPKYPECKTAIQLDN
jgi:ssDNA-binding Zn-finger/Zn-ribbon topoisomerase 1